MKNKNQFHVIRAEKAGVFIGKIVKESKDAIIATNIRRLYYWTGALDVTQIAKNGVGLSENRFSSQLGDKDLSTIYNPIEVHPLSQKALETINSVPEWKN